GDEVGVPDDRSWSDGDVLRAAEVRVAIRLLPALFGRIELGRITVREPVLTVIRDLRGFNLDTLGPEEHRERTKEERRENRSRVPVVLALLQVRDGAVHYSDRRSSEPRELTLGHAALSASDASLTRPIAVRA